MNTYTAEQILQWQTAYGPNITKTMTERGLSVHKYRVTSTNGKPLPEDDHVLICFCDGWWPVNFGGVVSRSPNGLDAAVEVHVD